jgi:methionyl-tRNA synthetase
VVIYVRDFLSRYDADALRYYITAAGPETQDTDFTWAEFLRRNNDELVAGWGNLVNRSISMAAKNLGEIPAGKDLTAEDEALLQAGRDAFAVVGDLLNRSRFKAALGEAMRVVAEANKYLSDMEPWKLKSTDPERMATVLHVALQVVDDAKTLLTPFLPFSSDQVFRLLGGEGVWSPMPELREVEDLDGGPGYPVLTGDYTAARARWESTPIEAGRKLDPPTPIFKKLDPSIVDEELARLAGEAA